MEFGAAANLKFYGLSVAPQKLGLSRGLGSLGLCILVELVREELRKVLTVRQEAALVASGILE